MLIACKFKRPSAPVELGDQTYFFTPSNPADPNSEHVAEVTDEEHIGRLLSITEGYHIAKSGSQAVAARPAPATPPAPTPAPTAAPAAPSGDGTGEAETSKQQTPPAIGELSDEQAAQAAHLASLGVTKLKEELASSAIEDVVIAEALRLEESKPEDDQRVTTINLLQAQLKKA